MSYTNEQIKEYVKKLNEKGAPISEIDKFVSLAIKERDTVNDSFAKRLQTSFGSETERATINEPKGFMEGGLAEVPKDVADVAGKALPLGGMLLGGAIGAGSGIFGGPAGVAAGATLGAGVGAGLGERTRQDIGSMIGVQKSTTGEKLKEMGKESVAGALGELGGRATTVVAKPIISKVIKPIYKGASELVKNAISVMTSVPENAIERALIEPSVKQGFNKAITANTIRKEATDAYFKVAERASTEFEEGLTKLKKLSPTYKPSRTVKGQFSNAKSAFAELLEKAENNISKIFNKFSISLEKGSLNFDKLNSSIVSGAEQKQIREVFDVIKNQADFSTQGVQRVAARINALTKYTEGAQSAKSAVIKKIHDLYSGAIDKVYPELGKLRKDYSITERMLENADAVINATKSNDTRAIQSAIGKLTNIFKEDKDGYIAAILKLEEASGKNILNKLAGTEFQRIAPGILRTSLAVGGLASLVQSPMAIFIAPLFSPRFWGAALVKTAQSKIILESIFKNYLGVDVLNPTIKVLINKIIEGKIED